MIKKSDLNIAISLMGGNILEFYCFILIPLSSKGMVQHFLHGYQGNFPSTMLFLISFIGYISRPAGAVLLGHIADRYGRKGVVTKAVLITAILTGVIAFIPGSAHVGILSPISLIIIRLLQGFCVSGEEGVAIVWLSEKYALKRNGYSSCLILSGVFIGILLGMLSVYVNQLIFSENEICAFAWRYPFLVPLVLGPYLYFSRLKIMFADVPSNKCDQKIASRLPILDVIRSTRNQLPQIITLNGLYAVSTCAYMVVIPNFQNGVSFSKGINIIGMVFMIFALPFFGIVSDICGKLKFQVIALTFFLITWIFAGFIFYFSLPDYLISISLLGSILSSSALLFPYLIEVFEKNMRCSGVGTVFNSCISIFSGFLPVVNSWVASVYGFEMFWYVIFSMLLLSYVCLCFKSQANESRLISIST